MAISLEKDNQFDELDELHKIIDQNVNSCYQCGKCSASCPFIDHMDIGPQKVLRLLQLGQIGKLTELNTIWICGACEMCAARCPRGVNITGLMEGLRNFTLRNRDKNVYEPIIEKINELPEDLPQIALINCYRKLSL